MRMMEISGSNPPRVPRLPWDCREKHPHAHHHHHPHHCHHHESGGTNGSLWASLTVAFSWWWSSSSSSYSSSSSSSPSSSSSSSSQSSGATNGSWPNYEQAWRSEENLHNNWRGLKSLLMLALLKRLMLMMVMVVMEVEVMMTIGHGSSSSKMESSKYNHPIVMMKVVADIQLIFDNCRAYNRFFTNIYFHLKYFWKKLNLLCE